MELIKVNARVFFTSHPIAHHNAPLHKFDQIQQSTALSSELLIAKPVFECQCVPFAGEHERLT